MFMTSYGVTNSMDQIPRGRRPGGMKRWRFFWCFVIAIQAHGNKETKQRKLRLNILDYAGHEPAVYLHK